MLNFLTTTNMIRLPFTFTNALDNQKVTIDLYDVASLSSGSSFMDEETGENIELEKECVIIYMNNDSFYIADLPLSTVLFLSKEYWRVKSKKAIKELFKTY
ncbi:MAG: hypothetical protein ACI308_04325 [Muribaculaceae bacterium]